MIFAAEVALDPGVPAPARGDVEGPSAELEPRRSAGRAERNLCRRRARRQSHEHDCRGQPNALRPETLHQVRKAHRDPPKPFPLADTQPPPRILRAITAAASETTGCASQPRFKRS